MRLPHRVRLAGFALLLLLGTLTLARLVFWRLFGGDHEASLGPFLLGLRFDLRFSLLMMVPSLLLWRIPRLSPFRDAGTRRFHATHLSVLVSLVVLFLLADLAHYDYLRERANSSSLRFLEDTAISARFLWETYPIVRGLLLTAAVGAGVYFLTCLAITRIARRPEPGPAARRATAVVFIALVLFGIYGKVSFYPLRWSDAFSSPRRFDADLALNPVLFFCDTLCTAEAPPPEALAIAPYYARVAEHLHVPAEGRRSPDLARPVRAASTVAKPLNAVVILMESLSAHETGVFGNPLDPSPNLDALARESALFTRCYTPSRGTARAVFAMVTGIPDTSTNRTASRNPRAVEQYTILDACEGYEKFYFLGGSASWANVRGLLAHNVRGIRIFEEGSYEAPRGDVWGISDLALFEEANRVLRAQERPFLAIIHLSGNHRPYTIPEDNRGFRKSDTVEASLARYGFDSREEFDSFRFMDHSLGFFMETARREAYYEKTIFIVLGDNGDPGNAPHLPRAETVLDLSPNHIPLVVHGPGIPAGIVRTVVSQIDVFPTVAAAIGAPVTNRTLGRNVLAPDLQGCALLQKSLGPDLDLWLVNDRFCLAMNEAGGNLRLYDYESPDKDVAELHPGVATGMRDLGRGLYLTARYLLYNNPRQP